jgi:hypothetical protein
MVDVSPPIDMVAVRDEVEVLGLTVTVTMPLPLPPASETPAHAGESEVAVHVVLEVTEMV